MTTEDITIWHCDANNCTASAPADTTGWTNAIHTHGCPAHGQLITAHKAKITSDTRGRGYREKTTWYLTCACGWTPRPSWATHTYRRLEDQHLAHVQQATTETDRVCVHCRQRIHLRIEPTGDVWEHTATRLGACPGGYTEATPVMTSGEDTHRA